MIALAVSGCGTPVAPTRSVPPSGQLNGTISWSAPQKAAVPGVDQGDLVVVREEFALWYDEPVGSSVNDTHNEQGTVSKGYILRPDRTKITFHARVTPDGKGTVLIDGVDYNLTAGRLFLITTHAGSTRVKQLRRDLSALQFNRDILVQYAKADQELRDFFRREVPSPSNK